MRSRKWPISTKFIALLVTPVLSLIILWIFTTSLVLESAHSLSAIQTYYDEISTPCDELITELQRERRLSLRYTASKEYNLNALEKQRAKTDMTIARIRTRMEKNQLRSIFDKETRQRIDYMLKSTEILTSSRLFVNQKTASRTQTFQIYTDIIDNSFHIYQHPSEVIDHEFNRHAQSVIMLGRAREVLSQEDALLSGITASEKVTKYDLIQLTGIINTHRFLFQDGFKELPDAGKKRYENTLEKYSAKNLRILEDILLSQTQPDTNISIDIAAWQESYDTVSTEFRQHETAIRESLIKRSRPAETRIMIRLGLAAIFGLISIAVSIVISIQIWRSLLQRLGKLEIAANSLANEHLPSVIQRLRKGENVDIALEAPSLNFGDDEIGKVGTALSEVQRTAIESAINESRLRAGLNKVFINIARRSQTLLNRQLSLLDGLERQTIDPEKLQELFQLDHLATRMRRHAEDLIILAGAAPARSWQKPVTLINVMRGSISEVENYARITIQSMPEVSIAGPAVADITHLLSEMLENASAFSPPDTFVQVSGALISENLEIRIEDHGLGMPQKAIDEANEKLSHPPDFDPGNSSRLGLLVVATLAARRNISVKLSQSNYGGIIATIAIPQNLIVKNPQKVITPKPDQNGTTISTEALKKPIPRPVPSLSGRIVPRQKSNRLGWNNSASGENVTVSLTATSSTITTIAEESPPPTSVSDQPHQEERSQPTVTELTADGLPKRSRRKNVASALRHSASEVSPHTTGVIDGEGEKPVTTAPVVPTPRRSPEELRSMMTAFQEATRRGRKAASLRNSPSETTPVDSAQKSDREE